MKLYYETKPGELEHGLFGFGTKKLKQNVKYLKKIPDGKGGYRYIYTQKELDAYNAKLSKNRSNAEQTRQSNIAAKRNAAYNKTLDIRNEAAEYQKEADIHKGLIDTRKNNIKDINDKLAKEKKSLGGILNTKKSRSRQAMLEYVKAFDEAMLPINIAEKNANLDKAKQKYDERDKIINDILRGNKKKKK